MNLMQIRTLCQLLEVSIRSDLHLGFDSVDYIGLYYSFLLPACIGIVFGKGLEAGFTCFVYPYKLSPKGFELNQSLQCL